MHALAGARCKPLHLIAPKAERRNLRPLFEKTYASAGARHKPLHHVSPEVQHCAGERSAREAGASQYVKDKWVTCFLCRTFISVMPFLYFINNSIILPFKH